MVVVSFFFPLQKDIHKPEEELFEECSEISSACFLQTVPPTQSEHGAVFLLQDFDYYKNNLMIILNIILLLYQILTNFEKFTFTVNNLFQTYM